MRRRRNVLRPRLLARTRGIASLAAALLLAGATLSFAAPPTITTPATTAERRSAALGNAPLRLRLAALEGLRGENSSKALDAMVSVAREGDVRIQVAACAELGRAGGDAAKSRLEALLEDPAARLEVRMAAASTIAGRWRDAKDLPRIEMACAGDPLLAAHGAVLRAELAGLRADDR